MRGVCLAVAAALLMAGAGPVVARDKPATYADPADVITAEIAFARAAKDKGQWSAARKTAAPDAVMFVPQKVSAAGWLNGRKDPALSAQWSASEVWMSCDGSAALVDGTWHQGADHGWFSTVWQRQKNGGYKWLLQDGDRDAQPAATANPDDIESLLAHLADCPRGKARESDLAKIAAWNAKPAAGSGAGAGSSTDHTLRWESSPQADGAHNLSVWMWKDGDMQQVHVTEVDAPSPAARR